MNRQAAELAADLIQLNGLLGVYFANISAAGISPLSIMIVIVLDAGFADAQFTTWPRSVGDCPSALGPAEPELPPQPTDNTAATNTDV